MALRKKNDKSAYPAQRHKGYDAFDKLLRRGASRAAEASSIISGATVRILSASKRTSVATLPDRCGRAVEVQEPCRSAHSRDGGRDGSGTQQAQYMTQAVETKCRTEISLDQPSREQRFASIAHGEDDRAHESPVAQQVGHDGRNRGAGCHWQPRARSQCDQGTRGDP